MGNGISKKDLKAVKAAFDSIPKEAMNSSLDALISNVKKTTDRETGALSTRSNWRIIGKGKSLSIIPTQKIHYASIQNYGGKVKVTAKMRKYFWAMFKKTKRPKYKAMALSKKSYFKIPAADFATVNVNLEQSTALKRKFKQI